jgi:hypothetical protein
MYFAYLNLKIRLNVKAVECTVWCLNGTCPVSGILLKFSYTKVNLQNLSINHSNSSSDIAVTSWFVSKFVSVNN